MVPRILIHLIPSISFDPMFLSRLTSPEDQVTTSRRRHGGPRTGGRTPSWSPPSAPRASRLGRTCVLASGTATTTGPPTRSPRRARAAPPTTSPPLRPPAGAGSHRTFTAWSTSSRRSSSRTRSGTYHTEPWRSFWTGLLLHCSRPSPVRLNSIRRVRAMAYSAHRARVHFWRSYARFPRVHPG